MVANTSLPTIFYKSACYFAVGEQEAEPWLSHHFSLDCNHKMTAVQLVNHNTHGRVNGLDKTLITACPVG